MALPTHWDCIDGRFSLNVKASAREHRGQRALCVVSGPARDELELEPAKASRREPDQARREPAYR